MHHVVAMQQSRWGCQQLQIGAAYSQQNKMQDAMGGIRLLQRAHVWGEGNACTALQECTFQQSAAQILSTRWIYLLYPQTGLFFDTGSGGSQRCLKQQLGHC